MNKDFLNYIRHLSKKDKKTLSQKALKAAEEVGELARCVLPYDNAYATTHRFIEREQILEEAVDTMLCAMSVAYDLDFTDEEIDEMLLRKSEKWALLQSKEQDVKYPLPYEIHITVDMSKSNWLDQKTTQQFTLLCQALSVKPIVLDLQNISGDTVLNDVMTSSKHFGDNRSALAAAQQLADDLVDNGFFVVRKKIETVPWHPAAPKFANEAMPPNCYFESHIGVTLPTKDELDRFRQSCTIAGLDIHISRNAFKKNEDGSFVIMATHRTYQDSVDKFKNTVEYIRTYLTNAGFNLDKPITEFAVYDTKISHDSSWLRKDA